MGNCFLEHCVPAEANLQTDILKSKTKPEYTPKLQDFKKLKVLGNGSLGTVYLVQMKKNSKTVNFSFILRICFFFKEKLFAMKILTKRDICKNNLKEKMMNEKEIFENLDHPFIVKLRFAFQTSKNLYLVMDFMQGGNKNIF